MELPSSWRKLVRCLAVPDVAFRDEWRGGITSAASIEKARLLALSGTHVDSFTREQAQLALWWSVIVAVPAVVFEQPRKPCRAQVEARLRHVLGGEPPVEAVEDLMVVVKRIQRYKMDGRRGLDPSSFDSTSPYQQELLRNQGHRCAVCGYRFSDDDLDPDPSSGREPHVGSPVSERDRSPARMYRRAVLDHQLPLYLAGDDQANWQILCKTCNSGKSDSVLGFDASDWFGSMRLVGDEGVRTKLFYAVLVRDSRCFSCARGPMQSELHIVRRDPQGPDVYPNLVSACVDYAKVADCRSARDP